LITGMISAPGWPAFDPQCAGGSSTAAGAAWRFLGAWFWGLGDSAVPLDEVVVRMPLLAPLPVTTGLRCANPAACCDAAPKSNLAALARQPWGLGSPAVAW